MSQVRPPRLLSDPERLRVVELLGRPPRGDFEVVVRNRSGDPVVIRNHPFLHDGTPMPTLYWLVGTTERRAVDRLEAAGGVRRARAEVAGAAIQAAHDLYAAERDRRVPAGAPGPRPSGGVGGTRHGVKCLHAHYAWYLAGGPDPVGLWVQRQLNPPVAAVDCGTNSTRLLVARPGGPALERLNRITRLGEGVDRTGRLAPEAIDRTLEVLRAYREVMDRLGAGAVRVTATSAARDAANRDEFLDAAAAVLGARPELLDGREEGRLSYAGAVADLDPARGPWLVVDIGGGSTELIIGGPGGPAAVVSLDVGCVRLTERSLHHDPPTGEEIAEARSAARRLLRSALETEPLLGSGAALVGLAGTVAAMAAMDQGLDGYDRDRLHHYRLERRRVEAMLDELAVLRASDRAKLPGIEPARADVIVGGAIVLSEVMETFGFGTCLTSEADILDGLVLSLEAPDHAG